MGPSLCPSSVAVLSNAAYEHHHPRSTDDEEKDDEFEFRPLLPQPRRRCARTAERPRIISRHVAVHACKVVASQPPSSQSARRVAAAKAGQAP
jgi:hypothetical protein